VPPAPVAAIVPPAGEWLAGAVVASQWRPQQRAGQLSNRQGIRAASATVVPGAEAQAVASAALDPEAAEELPAPHAVDPAHAAIVPGVVPPPAPRECAKVALPPYIIEPPDILLIETSRADPKVQPVRGQHLVRPDGTVSLGIYGQAFVGGMTLDQARASIGQVLGQRIKEFDPTKELNVDVLAYNSKFYYIITDGGGYGQQVYRLPITGSETVLDAIAQIYGTPAVAAKDRIWVARRSCSSGTGAPQKLPVNWTAVAQCGDPTTNYQLVPGDRIFVQSDALIRVDSWLGKIYAPIQRTFGLILLGSETVNSLKGGTGSSGTGR
jgi:polysaccharide export outer membrane protein